MRKKLALFFFPRLIHWLSRIIVLTCRIKIIYEESENWSPHHKTSGRGRVYACWHGELLLCTYLCRGCGVSVIVSQSRDGEYLARALQRWKFFPLRGSSSRGGAAVYRQALNLLRDGKYLAIAPDGPRGPRRNINPGTVHLAVRTGCEIVPMASCASKKISLNSWDKFEIPLPFSTLALIVGRPLKMDDSPGDVAKRDNEERLKIALNELSEKVGRACREINP